MHASDGGEVVDSTEGDSQCPTCGSVVMASDIEEPNSFRPYVIGFLCGIVGPATCLAVLFIADAVQFSWSITWIQ